MGSLGQGHQGQMCQNRLSNNFENEFLFPTFVQMTNPVLQKICDKKNMLGGILFYKHLLFQLQLGV